MMWRKMKWVVLLCCLAVLASLPWILNACGSSSSGGSGGGTTHTMTLKRATS